MRAPHLEGHLFLIGFMGSGKSAMGRLLAERLGRPFLDLDEWIEARQGTTIREIFARHGEAHFRRLERDALRECLAGDPAVVALGGGTFLAPENRRRLRHAGLTVWLDVPLELALERCAGDPERPLADDPEHFRRLYQSRRDLYGRADLSVPVGDDPKEETCSRILHAIRGAKGD